MNIIQRILSFFRNTPLTVNRKISIKNCAISDIRTDEVGEETGETYNYYRYLHPSGRNIIMREKTDGTEYRYASGSFTNRTNLEYKKYSAL